MLLFLDTESHPISKRLESITYHYGQLHTVLPGDRSGVEQLFCDWRTAEAVVLWNGPYDLGALASMPGNDYYWDTRKNQWKMLLFGTKYYVRKINMHRNIIRGLKGSPPVIDLLKLWSILIDDGEKTGGLSLKHLIKTVLHREPIEYSAAASRTREYMEQDVVALMELWTVFVDRIKDIEVLKEYSYSDWAYIKTPATFTKLAYERRYPYLQAWKDDNDEKTLGIDDALEQAYHGGITIAFYRGILRDKTWLDIKSAYANAIKELNTDQWLNFDIVDDYEGEYDASCLHLVTTDFVMMKMRGSLKMFRLVTPTKIWLWHDDLLAIQKLSPESQLFIERTYKFTPLVDAAESLPSEWMRLKDDEERTHGKTTRYKFFKDLSNCSYGIKAQRNPFETIHTNMAVAGMITAHVHLVLATIYEVAREHGAEVWYSDTDSVLLDMDLTDEVNEKIRPFIVENEGTYRWTRVLSLKRYASISPGLKDKLKLHGIGRYDVRFKELKDAVVDNVFPERKLKLKQYSATTIRTYDDMVKRFKRIKTPHPFMFELDVDTDRDWADWAIEWFKHIDTKTTIPSEVDVYSEFQRTYRIFDSMAEALEFYKASVDEREASPEGQFRNWDAEMEEDFSENR